ncbi:MAG: ABC transporter ATP-binding protein [Oscillospiraceae bacterium]
MAALNIEKLFCGYGGEIVVKDISFTLSEGEILSLAGPNGCGKTTLLRAVCGFIPIVSGGVFLDGTAVTDIPVKERAKRIAMLSQTGAGGDYFDYTVLDTVLMGRYARQKGGLFAEASAEDIAAAKKYIYETGLEGLENKLITELSGGQVQRVFLARAFAQEPDIILLDEPANHLDFKRQTELITLLRRWVKNDKSVIGVFHDINLAAAVSDRMLLMKDGESVLCEATGNVLKSEKLNQVFETDVKGYMKKIADMWT